MSSGEGVVSRCGFDPVECFVIGIVESVAPFVFLHAVDEGSVSLAVVGRAAVPARNLVDGVGGEVRGRSSLRLREEDAEGSGGGVGNLDAGYPKIE